MATSSTSLEASCLAPTYFKLSSSFDSNDGAISVAVEHCQLCGGSKRPFYCESCVVKGDFTRSKCDNEIRYVRYPVTVCKESSLTTNMSLLLQYICS